MKVNTTRRNVFAGLALAAILGTTGCSAINAQATTFEYAPSDGTQTTVTADESGNGDTVDFLNIGVITKSANEPGRVMGTIHNKSDSRQNVTLEINNESFDFTLDPHEVLDLEEDELVVDPVGTDPGLLASGTASAFGNSQEFHVSVLPPTLEEYREIYPGDLERSEQVEHLYEFQGQYHNDEN
ncbi:MAG TPA: hypothetical protein VIG82_08665 [Enteractinococcus sp.]